MVAWLKIHRKSSSYLTVLEKKIKKIIILAVLFRPFDFIVPKTSNYLAFQSFEFERA